MCVILYLSVLCHSPRRNNQTGHRPHPHLRQMAGDEEEVHAAKAKLRDQESKVDEVRPCSAHTLVGLRRKVVRESREAGEETRASEAEHPYNSGMRTRWGLVRLARRTYHIAVAKKRNALLLAKVVLRLDKHVHTVHSQPGQKQHANGGALGGEENTAQRISDGGPRPREQERDRMEG